MTVLHNIATSGKHPPHPRPAIASDSYTMTEKNMPPKPSLKGSFAEAVLVKRSNIDLYQYTMRVCRNNRWDRKTGFNQNQMHEHTGRPALVRTIANTKEYTLGYRFRQWISGACIGVLIACFDNREVPGTGNYLRLQLFRRSSCLPSAPVAVPPPPPPPPPPPHRLPQPVYPASSMVIYPQLGLSKIQTSVDALPKHIADTVKTELDAHLAKCKPRSCRGGCCDHKTDGSEKRTRR
ncbi:hypothetical protein FN846DRAFT_895835 [Sphaerosporella brunnea]|uniref:Uncharacterized protein n=1 Tax=Sphaerosporella brunnea TaxID=1250544 RepID=A0A5J5EDD3_9PEZI|nr:hypothetical protein FN846DRAFT_895832 [Sphaerosporella brunnea]KAA8893605.1 hypothetical protein FN846DRAFT_895835 [Sphaerosporella brunnea]